MKASPRLTRMPIHHKNASRLRKRQERDLNKRAIFADIPAYSRTDL
jgi:hypothetical protein